MKVVYLVGTGLLVACKTFLESFQLLTSTTPHRQVLRIGYIFDHSTACSTNKRWTLGTKATVLEDVTEVV